MATRNLTKNYNEIRSTTRHDHGDYDDSNTDGTLLAVCFINAYNV